MPSAAAKVEKVASSEANDPLKLVVNMLEKKMRNLEKRKVKLDNYKNEAANGKELNEDQKIAVSKGDEVKSVLEFAKDLIKQVNTIVQEHARQQKKLAKKEQLERQQFEIQRLTEAYMYVHILSHFQNEDVRSDFLNGTNGAVQLTSEQLSQLDQLYKLIGPGFPNEHADLTSHFHTLAENHIFLVEGKNKEIVGTTYKALKEILQTVNECGYLTRSSEPADATSSDETPEEE
ncbi:Caprin-1, partial [Stegodyphus mimosarum]